MNKKLFPGDWGKKVLYSDAGIIAFTLILYAWTTYEHSFLPVLLTYFLPYLVVNMWLVLYVLVCIIRLLFPYWKNWWLYTERKRTLTIETSMYSSTYSYTWLQHTDVDIPHLESDEWTWVRGAFLTVDRPYGQLLDLLHHRIGSTHVAHHVNSRIPHYNAVKATKALQKAFPDFYLYDPTPIIVAMWRVARNCIAVEERVSNNNKTKFWTFVKIE